MKNFPFTIKPSANINKDTFLDVIVFAGQSNSAGYGKGFKELKYKKDNDILMYNNSVIDIAKERKSGIFDNRAIFSLYFANLYKKIFSNPTIIFYWLLAL